MRSGIPSEPCRKCGDGEDGFLYRGARAETAFYLLKPSEGGGAGGMELEETLVSFHYNQLEYAPCVSLWRKRLCLSP